MASLELPPDPSTAKSYQIWKKDVHVWKLLTDLPEEKQGLALQYACRGNQRVHEAVLAVESAQVKCKEGFDNVVKALDGFFNTEQKDIELKDYEKFETIRREDTQTIADFLIEFDSVLNKTKAHGNVMSETLLGIKLMRAVNITEVEQQIIRAKLE